MHQKSLQRHASICSQVMVIYTLHGHPQCCCFPADAVIVISPSDSMPCPLDATQHNDKRIILTLVASAFIPPTNRTSESASVYNGICEVEQSWFTFCSRVDTLLVMMLMMPDEQGSKQQILMSDCFLPAEEALNRIKCWDVVYLTYAKDRHSSHISLVQKRHAIPVDVIQKVSQGPFHCGPISCARTVSYDYSISYRKCPLALVLSLCKNQIAEMPVHSSPPLTALSAAGSEC
ncbi:hypothetical protein D9C73_007737 [Collichthys lucidus]|uniref:Uncharacterized protein n=1 Tax=Collichthys lucidus TaxID=240159 RepID=A0A4U5UG76_COLLU|nr:hypothetical protein D9C73_007737 [Collichthys lucidus]